MDEKAVEIGPNYLRRIAEVMEQADIHQVSVFSISDWLNEFKLFLDNRAKRDGIPTQEMYPSYEPMMAEEARLIAKRPPLIALAVGSTYLLVHRDSTNGIKCRRCGYLSWNPHDVEKRFCAQCSNFHNA